MSRDRTPVPRSSYGGYVARHVTANATTGGGVAGVAMIAAGHIFTV
jgi:hypothetical protein